MRAIATEAVTVAGTAPRCGTETLADIRPGDHWCVLYRDDAAHQQLLTQFVRQGFETHEKVLYIYDDCTRATLDAVLSFVREQDVNLEARIQQGQLLLVDAQDAYLREGGFRPDRMLEYWQEETRKAVTEGYAALRATGEPRGAAQRFPGWDRLLDYESQLNSFAVVEKQVLFLCQYDVRSFPTSMLLDVLTTHPIVVIDGQAHQNFYYLPPEELLHGTATDATLGQWMRNLGLHEVAARERVRLLQSEHEAKAAAEARRMELERLTADLEQRVEERQFYARSLLESSIDALSAISPEGAITDVNQQMEALTGFPRQTLIGTPFRQYFTDPDRAEAGVRLVLQAGKVTDYELIARHRDGHETPVACNAATYYNQQHELQGVFAAVRDITERKKLDQELRDKQLYTRSLIETRIDALAMISPEGLITDVNRHMEELTGYPREQLIGTPFCQYFTDPERAEAGVRLVLETGKVTDYELVARSCDGRLTPVAYNAATFYNQEHELQGVFAAARDITERRRAEESLRRSVERYRSLALATAQIVWTTDPEGKVAGEMPSWTAYTGMGTQEIQGRGWINAVHPEDRERTAAIWSKAVRERALYHTEYRLLRSDGEYRHMVARGVPVLEADGSIREWIGTCTDITERKLAEQALVQAHAELEDKVRERTAELAAANQELEAFTYSVSHDLRAPLRHVASFTELLTNHLTPAVDQPTEHYLNRIRSGAERMNRLVEDLLNLSRVGREQLHRKATPLREVVDTVIRELDTGNREIDWRVGLLPTLSCDGALVKQVFFNLLANAVKFTGSRQHPIVEIGLVPSAQNAIYVRDNGVGFDMKYAGKLFGAFQRLHPPEQFPGTGIGLATVRRIIVKHGGQVWADAVPDAGATFYFTLEPSGASEQLESSECTMTK